MAQKLIEVHDLKKYYNGGDVKALDGVTADVYKGDVIAVIGPSGGGKSTFLRSLNLLETPTSGSILFNGVDITGKKVDLPLHRQKMGMVFQHFNLFPNKTVLENLTMAPIKIKKTPKAEAEAKARRILAEEWGVRAGVWSVTSWGELRREALAVDRDNFLNPSGPRGVPYLTSRLASAQGPFIATSDYDHAVPDLIRPWVPGSYHVLGADGFGFSDTRAAARRHYLIDADSVVVKALQALADDGMLSRSVLQHAVDRYDLSNVNAGRSGAQGGES